MTKEELNMLQNRRAVNILSILEEFTFDQAKRVLQDTLDEKVVEIHDWLLTNGFVYFVEEDVYVG